MALQLCKRDDLDDIWSVEGVEGRFDDDEDGSLDAAETARVLRFIERASQVVAGSLGSLSTLPANWKGASPPTDTPESVRYMTAVIATYFSATRRGLPSPEHVKIQFEMVVEWLREIKTGRMQLDDVTLSLETRPFVSNFIVKGVYRTTKVRKTDQNSIGSRASGVIKEYSEYWPWL